MNVLRGGALIAAMAACVAAAAAGPAPAIAGRWATVDAVIEIAPCAQDAMTWCGKVAALREAPAREGAIGFMVLRGMKGGPKDWRGQSHDGERGYDATARVDGDRLTLRSCIGPGLCETETWRRTR